jgi:gluconolactonase
MKSKATFVAALCFLGSVTALSQERGRAGGQARQAPPAEIIAPNIPGVVAGGTKIQAVKTTWEGGSDGPVALPDGSVVFAERPAGRVWKIDKDDRISLFAENTLGALGLGFDSKGRLIAAQTLPYAQPRIGVIYPKGQEAVLADNFEGKPFARPNDLVIDMKGGIYFTDPGASQWEGQVEQGWRTTEPAVFYIPPGGKAIKVVDFKGRPNGIQLSPDEKTLYVNNSFGEYLLAFDIQPDGTVRNQRNFGKYEIVKQVEPGTNVCDGLASDSEGRLYVANQNAPGVQVFSPTGQSLGTIPLPTIPRVLAFGGPGKKTLYVTSGNLAYVYKIQMLAQGPKGRAK